MIAIFFVPQLCRKGLYLDCCKTVFPRHLFETELGLEKWEVQLQRELFDNQFDNSTIVFGEIVLFTYSTISLRANPRRQALLKDFYKHVHVLK